MFCGPLNKTKNITIAKINPAINSLNLYKKYVALFYLDDKPGIINQALMDLGREVCTFKNPKCNICPVQDKCIAFKTNKINLFSIIKTQNTKNSCLIGNYVQYKVFIFVMFFLQKETKYFWLVLMKRYFCRELVMQAYNTHSSDNEN